MSHNIYQPDDTHNIWASGGNKIQMMQQQYIKGLQHKLFKAHRPGFAKNPKKLAFHLIQGS